MDPLECTWRRAEGKVTGPQVPEEGQRRDVFYPSERMKELSGKHVKNETEK